MQERQDQRRDHVAGGQLFVQRNAFVLGLVVFAGGLCLAMPFWGDQALFTVYGRQLTRGAVLYRDVFDIKQPGIFLFYAFGGSLFGFTEVGIHLFELIYWIAFSVFALLALLPYFMTRWGASLVPLFTVVVYYLYAGLLDLTQVEVLVAFPILLAWWLIDRAEPGTRRGIRRYVAAGLAAAAVAFLKHLYVLIILAFAAYALLRSRRQGTPPGNIRRSLAGFLVALLVPLLIAAAYFAVYGLLGRIWWAYFEMAPAAQLGGPRPVNDLIFGGRRFLIGHAPLLILGVLGSVHALRERARPRLHLVVGMILWGGTAAVAFLIQGWPQYKWSLFTVPIGILAAVGVEVIVTTTKEPEAGPRKGALIIAGGFAVIGFVIGASPRMQTRLLIGVAIGIFAAMAVGIGWFAGWPPARRWLLQILVAALAVSVGLTAIAPTDKVRALAEHDLALTVRAREQYRWSWSDAYRAADEDLDVLRSSRVLPGAIYVFGDPVLLLRAHRPQAVPILGWGPEFLDGRAWRELEADLRATEPSYIVVDDYVGSIVRRRHPRIIDWIEASYDVAFVGASGTWYVRASPPAGES
jgi:hypothetical protein